MQHRGKITTFYLLGATHYLLGKGQPPGTTTAKGYFSWQQGEETRESEEGREGRWEVSEERRRLVPVPVPVPVP